MAFQKPPYQISSGILRLIQDIGQKIGEINTLKLDKPTTQLRRENRAKAIHSSLAIEGNSLSLDKVRLIADNEIVIGPPRDIIEVQCHGGVRHVG
jgi:Fic family protein